MTTVVLVHGIWMNGWDMTLLRHRLRKAGFNTVQFAYHSVAENLPSNAQRLQQFLGSINAAEIHFVAHSLGGLLLRQLFHDFPDQKPGRIVTLATPHRGSYVAGQLRHHAFGRTLLGKAMHGLSGGASPWTAEREIGVIAGDRGMGVGRVLTRLPKPNDGTVVLDETPLQGMTDYLVVPVNHIGMLVSNTVAAQVIHFLINGVFSRSCAHK